MSTSVLNVHPNSLQVMAQIVAGIVSGTPGFDVGAVPDLMQRVHDKVLELDRARVDFTSRKARSGKAPAPAGNTLKGSTVIDDEKLWPGVSEGKRRHYLALAERYQLPRDAENYPIPHAPNGQIVTHDGVIDPFKGEKMQMLKSRLFKSYQLTRDDLVTMFRLPSDATITAPAYSERKRAQANRTGLGADRKAAKVAKSPALRKPDMPVDAETLERRAKATQKKRDQRARLKERLAAGEIVQGAAPRPAVMTDDERRAKAAQKKRDQRARLKAAREADGRQAPADAVSQAPAKAAKKARVLENA